MKLGYLHLGGRRHGLDRYGRLLMTEAASREAIATIDEELVVEGTPEDLERLTAAAEALGAADVVHVQYNRAIWGGGRFQVEAIGRFLDACPAPVVTTFHDVYPSDPWARWKRPSTLRKRFEKWRQERQVRGPQNRAARLLLHRGAAVVVCFEEERRRLADFPNAGKLEVVGHFVEPRTALPDREEARAALDVEGRRVITMLGFIHPRKGYDLAIEALPSLSEDVLLVFAGAAAPGNDKKLRKMRERADALGVGERLVVTGWLSDEEQERWLVATDLALCPFRFFSASGSMTTWLSAARPILVHGLPQVDEYRAVSPGAFFTFAPYEAEALARSIDDALGRVGGGADEAIGRLAEEFSLVRTVDRHLEIYRAAARITES